MKRALAIRHVAFEDLGLLAPLLAERGFSARYAEAPTDDLAAENPLAPDLVVVLGGPIGAYEEALYPFVRDELRLLERRLAAGRPMLGICLGAQLMARALGARVYPGARKEIGWGELALSPEGKESALRHLDGTRVLHWHGDTFDLPASAVRLASTRVCENQAFSYGKNAIGFQFHPEMGSIGFERWLIGHTNELAVAGIDVNKLRSNYELIRFDLEARARECLRLWLGEVAVVPGQNHAKLVV